MPILSCRGHIKAQANTAHAEQPFGIFKNKAAAKRACITFAAVLAGSLLFLNSHPKLIGTFIKAADETCGNVEWGEARGACAEKVLNDMGKNVTILGFSPGSEISMMVGNQGITFKTTRHDDYRLGRKDSAIRFETLN